MYFFILSVVHCGVSVWRGKRRWRWRSFLGFHAICYRFTQTFRRNILPPSSRSL